MQRNISFFVHAIQAIPNTDLVNILAKNDVGEVISFTTHNCDIFTKIHVGSEIVISVTV